MPVTSDDASWYTQLAGLIAGGFACFVGGIVSATWWVASKVLGFESRMAKAETALGVDLPARCATTKDLLKAEMRESLHEAIDKLQNTWGLELAGAREQRTAQAEGISELKAAVIRLHERIDELIKTGITTGRTEPRGEQ